MTQQPSLRPGAIACITYLCAGSCHGCNHVGCCCFVLCLRACYIIVLALGLLYGLLYELLCGCCVICAWLLYGELALLDALGVPCNGRPLPNFFGNQQMSWVRSGPVWSGLVCPHAYRRGCARGRVRECARVIVRMCARGCSRVRARACSWHMCVCVRVRAAVGLCVHHRDCEPGPFNLGMLPNALSEGCLHTVRGTQSHAWNI